MEAISHRIDEINYGEKVVVTASAFSFKSNHTPKRALVLTENSSSTTRNELLYYSKTAVVLPEMDQYELFESLFVLVE